MKNRPGSNPNLLGFRNRGSEIHRIEALSDAVFAFAVSLLAVSLEVPQHFHELKAIMLGGLPFFATVALLFLFWYQQYIFFRHYALHDWVTIVLNMAYLALVLFYLYPLKFLFSLLLGSLFGIDLFPKATAEGVAVLLPEDFPLLIIIFSIGYALIWLLLFVMHHRALKNAASLQLNAYEIGYTQMERRGAAWNTAVGLVAIGFAGLGLERMAGFCYLLIPVLLVVNSRLFARQLKRAKRQPLKRCREMLNDIGFNSRL